MYIRVRARARSSARARTSLELWLGLVKASCIIKKWFKQNSAVCRCPSGSCTGPSKELAWVLLIRTIFCFVFFSENFLSSTSIVPGQSSTSCRFCSIILSVPAVYSADYPNVLGWVALGLNSGQTIVSYLLLLNRVLLSQT